MVLDFSDKQSQSLSRKLFEEVGNRVVNCSNFTDLRKLIFDYFKGSDSKKANLLDYIRENSGHLVSRAHNHDYGAWGCIAGDFGVFDCKELVNLEREDPQIIMDINFYKGALAFLSYLVLPERRDFDLLVKTKTLDKILAKSVFPHSYEVLTTNSLLAPFSHFYLTWNFAKNAKEIFDRNNVEEGQIKLRYDTNFQRTIFSIEDSGPGISPENIEKIFGDYTSKSLEEKGGFGLKGAFQIVKQMRGLIGVISKTECGVPLSCMPGIGCLKVPEYKFDHLDTNTKFYVILPNK